MERKVQRFWLPLTADGGPEIDSDVFEVVMPAGAEIINARMIGGRAAVYAMVNTERKKMVRHLTLVSDNAPMRKAAMGRYVATLEFLDATMFLHLFDLGEREWTMPTR